MSEPTLTELDKKISLIDLNVKHIKTLYQKDAISQELKDKEHKIKVEDHESRIRKIETVIYKGTGAVIVAAGIISLIVSIFIK